ncbi:acyl transferase/acyl hydrolase/lysophospholipase [Aspergillus filifer]
MAAVPSIALSTLQHTVSPGLPDDIGSNLQSISAPGHQSRDGSTNVQLTNRPQLFVLSADDEPSLRHRIDDLRLYLQEHEGETDTEWLGKLADTVNEQYVPRLYRASVISDSAAKLRSLLSPGLKIHTVSTKPSVGFVFTGQGSHWPGMGKELLHTYPVFRQSLERCAHYMSQLGASYNIIDEILKPENDSSLSHPLLSQPIVTALQIALVDLLAEWGIHPNAVTGHSSGEIAAAYAAGMLSMENAIAIAYYRGITASTLCEKGIRGAMMAIGMSATDAQRYVATLRTGKATVGCINGPTSVTVSGDEAAITELETILEDKGIFTKRLDVEVAYHCHHMNRIASEYYDCIAHITPSIPSGSGTQNKTRTRIFSSVTGCEISASELDAHYWVRNLVDPVRMVDAVQSMCFEGNNERASALPTRGPGLSLIPRKALIHSIIEIGPHATLAGPIKQTLKACNGIGRVHPEYMSMLVSGVDATSTALSVAASLVCNSYPVNLHSLNNPNPRS